jgi:hypothetical protein
MTAQEASHPLRVMRRTGVAATFVLLAADDPGQAAVIRGE